VGKTNWRSFEKARTFVRQLQLKSKVEWSDWTKNNVKPDDIPANPSSVYKNEGWNGWGDWLDTGTVAPQNREFLPFKKARDFVHQLQLKNGKEWADWVKTDSRPHDIPSNPYKVYKEHGWKGLGDWLGTGTIANQNRIYSPFEEARNFVHNLKLKNEKEWRIWVKSEAKPHNIPTNPATIYKDRGWIGLGDWLGTGTVSNQNRIYISFEEARTFVRQLQLKNQQEWREWIKKDLRPNNIPANPSGVYKDEGWIGFGDWLGTGTVASQNLVYRPFEEARTFTHQLHLKNQLQWKEWARGQSRPDDIPINPSGVYKNKGWIGFGDWLGTGAIASKNHLFISFEEARTFVRQLQLKNQ